MDNMSIETVKITTPDTEIMDGECLFSNIVTLDPSLTTKSWVMLSQNTWAHEVSFWPTVFHKALVKTLKSSSALARR